MNDQPTPSHEEDAGDAAPPKPTGLYATILHQPAKVFFWIAAAGGVVLVAGLRLERRIGSAPFSDQSALERAIRMMAGLFVMMAPYFLVFALIYWLLYRFNRPSSPRLNFLHFALSTIGLGSFLLYAGYNEMAKTTFSLTSLDEKDIVSSLLMGIYTLGQLVFIGNVVAALMKKRIDW